MATVQVIEEKYLSIRDHPDTKISERTFKLTRSYPWQKWKFVKPYELYEAGWEWDGYKIRVNAEYTVWFGNGYNQVKVTKL
jgi:hypothetical protein